MTHAHADLPDLAKVAHALTGREEILIGVTQNPTHREFWPYAVGHTIYAPQDGLPRGALDLAAHWLYARHNIFSDFLPSDDRTQALAYLDLVRCAALGAQLMGVRANIATHLEMVARQKTHLTRPEQLLIEAARRFVGVDAMPQFPEVADATWQTLHALRHDAAAFYKEASTLVDRLWLGPQQDGEEQSSSEPPELNDKTPEMSAPEGEDASSEIKDERGDMESAQGEDLSAQPEENPARQEKPLSPINHAPPPATAAYGEYHAYTTAHDVMWRAHDLGTAEEAHTLRQELDNQGAATRRMIARLARKLERVLRARDIRHVDREMEDGQLDSARLARVIANPLHQSIYRQDKTAPARNAIVSLLIDNSGSMRGRPILTAALAADVLALTLERCGVPCEILGFTTRTWKGGQSRVEWIAAGRPLHPGRLNDLAHIVYKDAATPWRRARTALALATKDGVLKENIDGEALLWASSRLMQRPEPRKILIVISDGAPVDDSTLAANDSYYLERHLHSVVHRLSKTKGLELHAIGIGHDVTHTYPSAMLIRDVEELGPKLLDHLVKLFKTR